MSEHDIARIVKETEDYLPAAELVRDALRLRVEGRSDAAVDQALRDAQDGSGYSFETLRAELDLKPCKADRFSLTDAGNGGRFAEQHRSRIRFQTAERRWLAWDGRRWRRDEAGEVMRRGEGDGALDSCGGGDHRRQGRCEEDRGLGGAIQERVSSPGDDRARGKRTRNPCIAFRPRSGPLAPLRSERRARSPDGASKAA